MCIVRIAYNINRNVYMYLNTHIFPTTGYTRVLLFMFIRRELEGKRTGCLFQFTYCVEYINLVPKRSVVCPCVLPSVTFLVIVSSPKLLDVSTLNFVDA